MLRSMNQYGSQHGEEAVYEMLWDCKYCGQKKLLGLTHRFCAGCGAPQDPATRYFPPDAEKVAVKDHEFVGADVGCPACRQPMSRAAKCCTNCGSPIDRGAAVATKGDVYVPPAGYPQAAGQGGAHAFAQTPAPKSKLGLVLGIIGGILALVVGLILVAVFWKREAALEVTGHTWERSIAIERYENTRRSVWCDETPAGARVLSRRREQKGTSKEKDGETCATRKKDQGNGTYKEVKECTPKYRDVPVMADKCDVELTEWRPSRTLNEKGVSLADKPRWPVSNVRGGLCIGCEREGTRSEKYTVRFANQKDKSEVTCDVPEPRWSTYAKGSRWKGQVRVLTSGVDCDNLGRL